MNRKRKRPSFLRQEWRWVLKDPFADKFLISYLEASNNYCDAVSQMSDLSVAGKYAEFIVVAARVQKLSLLAQAAYAVLSENRLQAKGFDPNFSTFQ